MNVTTPDRSLPVTAAEIPGVLEKLEATLRELKGFRMWLGLLSVLLWGLALAAVLVLADWLWVLPATVRALGLAALAGLLVVALLLRRGRRYSRNQAAAEVEARFTELGQRLRTVVDYAAPDAEVFPASPGLLRALGRDTDRRTAGLNFRMLVPWRAVKLRAAGLCLGAAVAVVALFASPGLRTAALRMLLVPVHYTALDVKPGDATLRAGDELKLEVTLSGRPVSSARVLYREKQSDREWNSLPLGVAARSHEKPAGPLSGTFSTSLSNRQSDLDYRVVAGELESRVFHVKVIHPLVLSGVEAAITPPAYTRRPPEVVKQGSFKAIEGSRVQLGITLNHAPTTASLALAQTGDASPQRVPLEIDGPKLDCALAPDREGPGIHHPRR